MRRGLWLLAAMGLLVPLSIPASAGTSVGIGVTIGDAPPPPVVVIREEPHLVVVPGSTVYVVRDNRYRPDYDVFRYGAFWYIYNDGYWYRARSHRGPFRTVRTKYVPRAIMVVPARHWRHHPHGGPPGRIKKAYRDDRRQVVVVKEKGRKHKR
jgi:hypothetical protein